MDKEINNQNQIYIFDSLYTSSHIQMLKIIYGILPTKPQQKLAPFIKYLELQYTLKLVKAGFPNPPDIYATNYNSQNNKNLMLDAIGPMIKDLKPYLSKKETEQFEKLEQFYQMFQSFQRLQETLEHFETMTGIKLSDLANVGNSDNPINMDLLINLLGNDQKDLFESFMKGL